MSFDRRRPEALLIAGPTASGKSALAVRLAARLGGVVVNADSMQVYRDLRLLTARPSEDEVATAAHALYGTVDGAVAYSVNQWLGAVAGVLEEARISGIVPIIVGGTGLYLKALTEGLSAIPPVPAAVRAEVRGWAEGRPAAELHAALAACDAVAADRIRPSDPQRIVRALEVHRATGFSLATFQTRREPPLLALERTRAIVLTVDRAVLRERAAARFDRMLAMGALEEVHALAGRGLDETLPVMRALGVPPLLQHLRGEIGYANAVACAKNDTARYLKRQDTFARNQLRRFRPVPPHEAEAALLDHS